MDRREFIKIGAGGILGSMVPATLAYCAPSTAVHAGWLPDKHATANFIRRNARPYLVQQAPYAFKGSGKGRVVLLHKYLERAIGKIIPHDQGIGDCVGQAYGFGVDILSATQIYGLGLAEKWVAKASTEAAYAGSRYEIGYKVHGNRRLLVGDGSVGVYCAEFLRDYGVLYRKTYGDVDLSEYSASLARDWGANGVPDDLEPIAKQHPVRSFALVRSYNDCRDAIANGYPIIFCSSVGFNPNCRQHNPSGRDSFGFLRKCGTWYHAMCGIGVDDTSRPGILIMNSWGPNWVSGGTRHDQPEGSFWVDAATIDSMCEQGDSFAISGLIGFPAQRLDYNLF